MPEPIAYSPTGVPIYGRNARGQPVCSFPLRNRPGDTCQEFKLTENGRCRRHGGNEALVLKEDRPVYKPLSRAQGIAGRLPAKMRKVFAESLDDPLQLSLSPEIAVMDALIADLMSKLKNETPTADKLARISIALMDLGAALETGDVELISPAYDYLTKMVHSGNNVEEVKRELMFATLQRGKMVESDSKRQAQARLSLNATDAETLVVTIFRIFSMHEDRADVMTKVERDFAKYLHMSEERLKPKSALLGEIVDAVLEESDDEA